eukprot:TRINITY_DN24422_c0_g1_i1.p1 TRINITY_DN24422_c0_g1~~TRINITY_DN24422_c0_g1_i1.p1  ORF type:complete len:284 (+),score=57.83 TRINITY_DN24422_c0_g1_i1:128-979(+)
MQDADRQAQLQLLLTAGSQEREEEADEEERETSVFVLLAHLRSSPLPNIRALHALLPAAASEIRSSMHILGPLVCSVDEEVAAAAEGLLEAIKPESALGHIAGQRNFAWRDVEVDYWELDEAEGDLLLGYAVWPSATIMARLLVDAQLHAVAPAANSHTRALQTAWAVKGLSVLEVGAGVGLAGLVCQALGAARVLLTDGELRLVEPLLKHHGHLPRLSSELLDWRSDCGQEEFDLILGCDVLLSVAEVRNKSRGMSAFRKSSRGACGGATAPAPCCLTASER